MKKGRFHNKEEFDRYILVGPGSDYGNNMWRDIVSLDNATLLEQPVEVPNKILQILHHIHFSFNINSHVRLPFQEIWRKYYSLNCVKFDNTKRYCIIFTDVSACRVDSGYIKKLHQQSNIKTVLVLVNTMQKRSKVIDERLQYFNLIYSFDKDDSIRYHFLHYPTIYSKIDLPERKRKSDAFFVGQAYSRLKLLHRVYMKIIKNGAKADFYITGVKNNEKNIHGIHYNHFLSYSDVLQKISETGCIVEVMDGNQKGFTLRAMEAICYNKKLLTNNRGVKELSFYKKEYIQVFSKVSDIDTSFIKNTEKVDYCYHDEFSPIHFIERINKDLSSKDLNS